MFTFSSQDLHELVPGSGARSGALAGAWLSIRDLQICRATSPPVFSSLKVELWFQLLVAW